MLGGPDPKKGRATDLSVHFISFGSMERPPGHLSGVNILRKACQSVSWRNLDDGWVTNRSVLLRLDCLDCIGFYVYRLLSCQRTHKRRIQALQETPEQPSFTCGHTAYESTLRPWLKLLKLPGSIESTSQFAAAFRMLFLWTADAGGQGICLFYGELTDF